MTLLGFDTATPSTAVGLRLEGGRTLAARDDPGAGERPGHATRLLAMTAELLAHAGVGWGSLERIAVGVGPGTFTGLRVGVATARGLAQSLSVPLVGVSSLHALALPAVAQDEHRGVLAVIDARRGEAFAAAYRRRAEGAIHELTTARALAPEDLAEVMAQAERAEFALESAEEGDPEQTLPWLAVGDGAIRFREHLELAGAEVPTDESELHKLDARAICELAAGVPVASRLEDLVPDYLRRADAEIALESAGAVGA